MSLGAVAASYAAVNLAGSVVSVREDLPGEMLGHRTPGPVGRNIVIGLGSGTSAPWPMVMAVLASCTAARRRPCDAWPGHVCTVIGACTIAGGLIEPVTWGRRPSLAGSVVNWAGLVTGFLLVLAGRQAVVRARHGSR
jgi:hypothetical protein